MRETCEEESQKILNETIVKGKTRWGRRDQQSAINCVLTSESAEKEVMTVFIDEERESSLNTDHSLVLVIYECRMIEKLKMRQSRTK